MSGLLRRAVLALALGSALVLTMASACAQPMVHVVRPGESLWLIGKRYGVSSQDIARANSLASQRTIHSGVKLVIPQSVADAGSPAAGPPSAPLAAQQYSEAPKPAESAYRVPVFAGPAGPRISAAAPRGVGALSPAPAANSATTQAQPVADRQATHKPASDSATAHRAERAVAVRVIRADEPRQSPQQTRAPSASADHGAGTWHAMPLQRAPALGATPQGLARAGARSPEATATAAAGLAAGPRAHPDLFSSAARKSSGYGVMTALDFALKLVLVLILCYLCMLALKKFSRRRMTSSGKGAALRVVDTIGLAPNRQLHVVAVGDKAYLLGSTPESVSLIADISQAPEVNAMLGGGRAEPSDPAFSARLRELMKAAPAARAAQRGTASRLVQAAQFIKARSNQMRPLGEIIDETLAS